MAVAALGAAISTAVGGPITIFGTVFTGFSAFLVRTAIGAALNALTPKPKTSGANRGYQVTTRGSALDHQIIYGRVRTGGVIVFDETTGTNNKYLHRVIAFAGHEVESFDEIYLNDDKVEIGGIDYTVELVKNIPFSSGTDTETVTFYGVPASDAVYEVGDALTKTQFKGLLKQAMGGGYDGETLPLFNSATVLTKEIGTSNVVVDPRYAKKVTKTVLGFGGEDGEPILEEVTRRVPRVRVKTYTGSPDQLADSDLVNESGLWTNSHRLRGIAYLYIRLKFDADIFPNGIPDISATVKGSKVYDPRTGLTEWSDNPALCLRDYLTEGYGLSEDTANIDDLLVQTAANVCGETDTVAGTARYTCNGAFVTQIAPVDIMNDLLTSMGGLLWYAQGEWRMKPAYYVAPTLTFTEDDLRSSISVKTRHSRRDNFNTVKGTFRGEESNWQVTDYPEVTNTAFVEADGGQESVLDLELPFTDNSIEARRIARIALERNRQQLTVSASFGLKAFQVQTGDIIKLSVDRFGWTEKEFEVVSWTFGLVDEYDLQVQMALREVSESVFDEVDDGIVYERDNTSLLSPFEVPTVGLNAVATTQVLREKLTNLINVTVSSGRPEGIDRVEVEYKASSESEYTSVGTGEIGLFRIVDVETGDYDFRARAINSFGVKGEWEYLFGITADSLLGPPADVAGLTAEVNGATIHLEWEPVADLDLSYYRIRHSVEETGATWANATTAVDKVPRPASAVSLPTRPGTYHIKAVDKSGIASTNYTSVVVPLDNIQDFTNTDTQVEDPTFSGTKTDCSVVSSALEITDVSSAPSSATYDFSTYIDTGSVRRVRSRVEAEVLRKDNSAGLWDDLPGLFDDLPGLFGDFTGGAGFADINVQAYISTTQDDPSGTPTWSDYQLFRAGEYYGRAFRFRVVLSSTSVDVTPSITGLQAIVEYD